MTMLKGLQILPFCLKRLPPKERFGEKLKAFANCRCLYLSSLLQKKGTYHKGEDTEDRQRLKREAPFLFKTVKGGGQKATAEEPIIFRPIRVKKQDLEDDLYRHNIQPTTTRKKENVYIIQPHFRLKRDRALTELVNYRLAEAISLIDSIQLWAVHAGYVESIREVHSSFFFGSGKVLKLSENIRDAINNDSVTMVFLNTARLTLRQTQELESVWGCKVFDRHRVVLELFKERAMTQQAKVQVQIAELKYKRSHLVDDSHGFDQQRGGGKSMSGSGETHLEKTRRIFDQEEVKLKKALKKLKSHKSLIKSSRLKKAVPQVAMVGYTNAGKTTLAKALSCDDSMVAEDKLFATLDTTVHRGKLPNGVHLDFIDTVGFISDLPHEMVESFHSTLEDVRTADLIVHVADCSHPEYDLQKETVFKALWLLDMPDSLMRNRITVLNKVDMRRDFAGVGEENAIAISATEGTGMEDLRMAIEEKIMQLTGRRSFTINLYMNGPEIRWLYVNGTVLDTIPCNNGSFDVVVILNEASKNKFEKEFGVELTNAEKE